MAEKGQGAEGSAFEILGRIEVDLGTLRKSLGDAEGEVRASGERLKRVWAESSKHVGQVIFNEGALPGDRPAAGGEGPGGSGGEPGRSATAQFAHLARIIRSTLIPVLSQLSPEMGRVISATAQSARTAVFFGGAVGGVAVGVTALSVVLGAYLKAAREATTATFESSQALRQLDAARAEAGIKKITEAIAEYNLQQDIASGKVEAGFWQRLMARIAITTEAVTGSLDQQVKKYKEYAENVIKINAQIAVPRGIAESAAVDAEVLAKMAELDIKTARTQDDLAAGFEKAASAIRRKTAAAVATLDVEEKVAKAAKAEPGEDVVRKMTDAADKAVAVAKKRLDDRRKLHMEDSLERKQYGDALAKRAADQAEIDKAAAATAQMVDKVEEDFNRRRADHRKQEGPELRTLEQRRAETFEKVQDALKEQFLQKDIERGQRRVEGAAATAEAVAQSEEKIAAVGRAHLGDVESASHLEDRLRETRERAIGPLLSSLEAANQKYASQKRELQALIDVGSNAIENEQKLADLEKAHADELLGIREKIARTEAEQNARAVQEREQRIKREIELEERRLTHLVAIGRVSMQEEISYRRGAGVDPRRSVEQQAAEEEKLLELKKQYADQYFRYYKSLGASTWAGQLRSAEYFLSQTVEGSKQWFDAVQRVADVYKGIHDEAKGIFQQQLGITRESMSREAQGTQTSIAQIERNVERQRRVDERVLSRGRGTAAQISGALNRQELFRTMDREGLSPGEAFGRAMQDPQKQLAETLGRVTTQTSQFSDVTRDTASSVADLGGAAGEAAAALRDAASAAAEAAVAMRAMPRGDGVGGGEGVLSSNGKYTNAGVSSDVDSALGLNLQRAGRRGPNTVETVQ